MEYQKVICIFENWPIYGTKSRPSVSIELKSHFTLEDQGWQYTIKPMTHVNTVCNLFVPIKISSSVHDEFCVEFPLNRNPLKNN
jgi:hypothetical protein